MQPRSQGPSPLPCRWEKDPGGGWSRVAKKKSVGQEGWWGALIVAVINLICGFQQ